VNHGKVVGWGVYDDSGKTSDVAKIAELNSLSTIHCILNFTRLTSIA
jgi:hypothetical protein